MLARSLERRRQRGGTGQRSDLGDIGMATCLSTQSEPHAMLERYRALDTSSVPLLIISISIDSVIASCRTSARH